MIVAGLDIETTGLEPGDHRIVEIYIGLWDGPTGSFLRELNQRIDPQRSILADAQRVHGISNADLAGCPTWDSVAPRVQSILTDAELIVAHNGIGFDLPFLNYELRRVREPETRLPVVDTMLEGRWATPIGKLPTLGELAFACDVPYDPAKAHAADYDVGVMMECFFRGVRWKRFQLPEAADPAMALAAAA